MKPANIAIIGGTGFENLPPEIYTEEITVSTRYGDTVALSISDNYSEPHKLYFLPRHGSGHTLAPHQIDYRSNTAALVELGVEYVIATNAVGSLRVELTPGMLLIPDDFIDFTRRRESTYFTGIEWRHTDFSVPYSAAVRDAIAIAIANLGAACVRSGTYVACDGPRFETPAEIRMLARWGGDVVGMTGVPEAVFAREAGLQYAALCVVTNAGAGLSAEPVDHSAVTATMNATLPLLREITFEAARILVASWTTP